MSRKGRPGKCDPKKIALAEQHREEARKREAKKLPAPIEWFFQQGWIDADMLRAGQDYQWLCVCKFGVPFGISSGDGRRSDAPSEANLTRWREATDALDAAGRRESKAVRDLVYYEQWPTAVIQKIGVEEQAAIDGLKELKRWWLRRGIRRAA